MIMGSVPMDSSKLPRYDIVIIGAGPVGLMLSTCLSKWNYKIKHIDNRAEPTPTGRADGIQPRSLDLLRNLELKDAIMSHKPAKVYEVAFWEPSEEKGIIRTGTWASCPDFIDARFPFTTLLHQGHIERVFLSHLDKHGVQVQRPWVIRDFWVNPKSDPEYPVEVQLEHADGSFQQTVRTKYLFGGDGARSFVRQKLGINFTYQDPIAHVWGVMDGVVVTDFPDIKKKCTIHSKKGSIMVIPREDNIVRLYIQLGSSTDADFDPRKTATAQEIQAVAKEILHPYQIEWETLEWFSAYPIGQGIAERYSLDCRVFIGGDACHTHSPKAGQGMNTAFLDAQNLAWKIHAVESGFARAEILETYETERKDIAETLLAFDNKYAKLFSSRHPAADEVHAASNGNPSGQNGQNEENDFVKTFKESCAFTSGYGVAYKPNLINWSPLHPATSKLIKTENIKLESGRLMFNADATRVVDANVVHLEQEVPWNGSFRMMIFAGKPQSNLQALTDFATYSMEEGSYLTSHLRSDLKSVSIHEKYNPHSLLFTFCTIFAAGHQEIDIDQHVPGMLARYRDLVYADDRKGSQGNCATAHEKLGFGDEGGVVVVRPDGYAAITIRLTEGRGTVDALNQYFGAFSARGLGSKR